MIAKSRLKFTIAVILAFLITAGLLGTIAGIGRLLAYFNRGADPAGIFQLTPTVPLDLADRVVWLPDLPSAAEGKQIDPYTRDQVAGTYLYGWSQLNSSYELNRPYGLTTYFASPALDAARNAITATVAAGWQVRQSNLHHTLQLAFFSDDGSVVAFTDTNAHVVQQLLATDGDNADVSSDLIESTSVYDVVMRLEDGNWRIRDMVRRGEGDALTSPITAKSPTNFVRVRDAQLILNGTPFVIAGINYYPQTAPWTKFWPNYVATTTLADLDLVRELGLNTVRIFVSYADFGGDQVTQQELDKLRHFLDQAQLRDLKVIVTLFDHHTDHAVRTWAADDRHLAALIPPLADHPAILAWDIKNEPNRDYGFNTQPLVDGWLRHVARTVRRHDPNHLITIGWSQPEAATGLLDVVDFISFHYFEALEEYPDRLKTLIAAGEGKPVLLQEFVLPTWNSFWPHGHSEAEQANYYATLLQMHREFPTIGFMVWTLHDFTEVPLAEFFWPWQRATQANMGLLRLDGSAKPAAAIIAAGGTAKPTALPWWHRWTKPFWLLLYAVGVGGFFMLWAVGRWWRRR